MKGGRHSSSVWMCVGNAGEPSPWWWHWSWPEHKQQKLKAIWGVKKVHGLLTEGGAWEWGAWRRECWDETGRYKKNQVWHQRCGLLPGECLVGERQTLVCGGKITSSGKTWIGGVRTGQRPGGRRVGELQLSAVPFLLSGRRPGGLMAP